MAGGIAPKVGAYLPAVRAQVLYAVGEKPRYQKDYMDPEPGEGEVVVNVAAAALNRRDLYITQGLYPRIKVPVILGSDGAGWLGERKLLIQPGLHWGDDPRVQSARYEMLGMPRDGTFAEQVAVPKDQVYDLPVHLDFASAAALPLAGLTAYRALFTRGQAKPGDRVLVSGVGGGVSSMVLRFALAAGCRVFVSSSRPEPLAEAVSLGAEGGFRYDQDGWTQQLREATGGVDLFVDGAAGPGFTEVSKEMAPGGRMVFYGGTRGSIPKLNPQILFWRQISILGSTMGSPAEFQKMLEFVGEHRITPAVDRVAALEELPDLLGLMEQGEQSGKLVVDCTR